MFLNDIGWGLVSRSFFTVPFVSAGARTRPTEMGMVCAYVCDTTVKHTVKRGLLLCWLFTRTDCCATLRCSPHPSASPPPSPLEKAFFVSANLQVQFSELRFNEIFYCMGWRMELISLPQSGKRMRRADQCCILFSAVFKWKNVCFFRRMKLLTFRTRHWRSDLHWCTASVLFLHKMRARANNKKD